MPDIEDYIYPALEQIDEVLQRRDDPLSTRPMTAALLFVEHFVLEVSHGNKEEPLLEPWFATIHYHVQEWYESIYGPAMQSGGDFEIAAVVIRSLPVEFRVPRTRTEIETEGERIWVVFPLQIDEEEEDPNEWLVSPPNLEKLSPVEARRVTQDVREIAMHIRQISCNLGTAELIPGEMKGFASGIQDDLKSAANEILRNSPSSLQQAIWSMQVALERSFKSLAIQETGAFRETHDLFYLFDDIPDLANHMNRTKLKRLARHDEAIDARYGHLGGISLERVYSSYKVTLEIIQLLTARLKRKLRMNNARFLIQMPPWLRHQEELKKQIQERSSPSGQSAATSPETR